MLYGQCSLCQWLFEAKIRKKCPMEKKKEQITFRLMHLLKSTSLEKQNLSTASNLHRFNIQEWFKSRYITFYWVMSTKTWWLILGQHSFWEFDHEILSTVILSRCFKKGSNVRFWQKNVHKYLFMVVNSPATFFWGDWSWNIFYSHSLPLIQEGQ